MKRRRVNRSLLLKSLALVVVLVPSAYYLNQFQKSRHRDFFFARGQEAREAGDLPLAVSQYQQAIQLGKQDYVTHSALAQTLFEIPDPVGAYLEALRAEGLDPDHFENHRLLAESAMKIGLYNDVQTWTDKLLTARPNDSEFLLMRARARFASDDYPQAVQDYELLLQTTDPPIQARVELATLYADRMNAMDKGRAAIDPLVENDDASAANRVAHGTWHLDQYARRSISASFGDLEQNRQLLEIARQDAQAALTQYPDQPAAYILAIREASISRQFQRAVEIGKQGLERFPDQRDLFVFSAAAVLDAGDKDQAAQLLARGLQQFPMDRDLLWQQANLQIELKDYDQAAAAVGNLEKSGTPKPQVRYMQARLLAAQNKFLDAIKEFENARSELVASPEMQRIIDLELGKCLAGVGDRAGQIQALRRAAGQNSSFLAAREQLAMALSAAGRYSEAAAEYRDIAVREQAPVGAAINLARLLVLQNQASIPSRRAWDQVDAILDQVEASIGPTREIAVVRAEALVARDRLDEARKLLADQPRSDASYAAQILLEVNQRQWQKADELIDDAAQAGFDSVEMRRSRALRAILANEPDQEQRLTSLLATPESWTAEQVAELEKELLPIALSEELDDLTMTIASSILAKDPSYVAARFSILNTQLRRKDAAGMRSTLSELEKISGQNAIWNYGQALTYVLNENATPQDLDRAQEYLNNATRLRPDWAEASALSGAIYDRQKNVDAAIAAYDQAIKLGLRRTQEARRLIDLLSGKGRFSDADAIIRQLSQTSPALSSSMSRKASEISWRLDDLQRAVEKAEEAARISENASDYLWLSQIRSINKDNAGAEQALQHALELEPDNSNVQFAWISFLRNSSRLDEARQAALQVDTQIDRTVPLNLLKMAELFQLLGMTDDQQRLIASIQLSQLKSLEEYQRFFATGAEQSMERRKEFLQRLVDAEKTQPDPEITRWARRQLAVEMLNAPEGPQLQPAQVLITKNLETQTPAIDDRKIQAIILTMQKGKTTPEEPLALFRNLLRDGWIPTPDEQLLLGQLFIASGDWSEGSRYFTQLLNRAEGRNPEHLKRYIRILLERKDGTEAELWLDVLRRDGVRDVETGVLLAEIRYQRGQFDLLIRDLLAQDTSYPETAWFQATLPLRRRFELLNVFATRLKLDGNDPTCDKFVAASETLKPALESGADFPGPFYAIQLLSRREYKNSISALEQVLASATRDELVTFADTLMTSPDVPLDQVERLEKLLVSVHLPEDGPVLQVLVARLREMRGDHTGSEAIYRELLAANPKNSVALNNLANLLALKRVKPVEALSLIEQAIALMGETPMLLDTRAMCHLAAGQLPLARKDMEAAVAQYPHPLLRFHLAQTMYEAREFALAKQEYERAVRAGLSKGMLHVLEQPLYDRISKAFEDDAAGSPPQDSSAGRNF